jgi:hypothetical protein
MSYKLTFSDPTKAETITVPDMPPGINTVDTSLNLVGRGYPNYGQRVAENFVHLLENFASAIPPNNPIEGQLWYDTSNPDNKVLRINDGTAAGTNWPSANGLYQQQADPRTSGTTGLKNGDIWVDTNNNLLNIYTVNGWSTIGPSVSGISKTGSEPTELIDSATNNIRRVILNWVDGYVVSVISSGSAFVPANYPAGMEGFPSIVPGITLTNKATQTWKFQGIASDSIQLGGQIAANYLLKNDTSSIGQQITGKLVFVTPNLSSPQGRDGVVIRVANDPAANYIQLYKRGNNAVFTNNVQGGQIIFNTKGLTDSTAVTTVSVSRSFVGINTSTATTGALLDVNGSTHIAGSLTVNGGLVSTNRHTPLSAIDTGTKGQITWDDEYVYVCIDTNTWKRSSLSTW